MSLDKENLGNVSKYRKYSEADSKRTHKYNYSYIMAHWLISV